MIDGEGGTAAAVAFVGVGIDCASARGAGGGVGDAELSLAGDVDFSMATSSFGDAGGVAVCPAEDGVIGVVML